MLLIGSLSLMMGGVLGLLGGGGSILAVPLLVYVLHVEPRSAIATSLVVVGLTAAVAAYRHAKAGNVDIRAAAAFATGAAVGAFGGGRLASLLPPQTLLHLFGVTMIISAVAMLRGRKAPGKADSKPLKAIAIGVVVGVVTGLVGAGGGFLVVPALVLLAGLPMHRAVGTSLTIIAINCAAGVAGHLSSTHIDFELAFTVAGFSIVGAIGGARAASLIDASRLRQAFAVLVIAMAAVIFSKDAPGGDEASDQQAAFLAEEG